MYVNDSPAALALLRQAEDQIRDNPGEAIRLFQSLLDEYPMKLVPVTEGATDQYISVRRRVLRNLRSNQSLLERYQLIATPQAIRMLESRQHERLAVTRPLTEPGLRAMLSLAQEQFESAHFDAALLWLNQALQHPACVGAPAAHAQYMRAIAAHYLGDAATMQNARAQLDLSADPGPALLLALDEIIAGNAAPTPQTGQNVLTRATPDTVRDLIAQPIWTRRLDESLLFRRFVDPAIPESRHSPVLDQRRRESDLMTAAATVCGDYVYVNEGYRITALDRYMGDVRWTFVDSPSLSLLDRDNDPPLDLNIIAVHGSALVSFTGHAHSDHRSGTGAVVCMDRFTGKVRWETKLDGFDLDVEINDLYPHGMPIIVDGSVFLLARKVSPQRLASTYCIALDLETGRMRWTRYLTSSGGLHRAGRPISAPAYDHGWLYVATPIGAMARLDSTTGEITWMRQFGVPINIPFQDQMRRPWEFSAPVVTQAGVVALQPDQRRVVLLDKHSGDVLQTFPASSNDAWGEVHYLLADEKQVYAVGRDIRAFPIDALTRSLWTLPPPATSRMVDDRTMVTNNTVQRLDLRGRVQLADGMLIAPSLQGVLFVDAETGQIDHRLALTGGNPVLVDAQLFFAGSDQLDAYMSFERAQEMLRARMAARPDDPAPALSLLRLAIRVGEMGLALSAADLAHHCVQTDPDPSRSAMAQQELFGLLLSIDRQHLADSPQQAEALYVVLGAVAQSAEQRIDYLLAYGDWLGEHDFGQAVEIYQQIMSDDQLAHVQRAEARLHRPAAYWAAAKLRELMNRHGDRIYAAQSDFAQRRLDDLLGHPQIDIDALRELASEFPFAPTAVVATQRVVDDLLTRGARREALTVLIGQYRITERAPAGAALLGAAVDLCQQAEWNRDGRAILEYVQERFGDIRLRSVAGPIPASEWLRIFGSAENAVRLASVGSPSDPVGQIDGGLVPMHPLAHGGQSNDAFVVALGSVISLYGSDSLEPRWSLDLAQPATAVLSHDADGIVLWKHDNKPDGRVVMVEPADGAVRWMTASLDELLGDARHGMIRATGLNEQMPDGSSFDPAEALPLLCGNQLVVVRRIGQVVSFDISAGPDPTWKLGVTMDQVHHVVLTNSALVLSGVNKSRSGRERNVATMLVLDPQTGRTMHSLPLVDNEPAAWIQIGPLGRAVYGSDAGIAAVDVLTGRPAWTNSAYDATDTMAGWLVGNTIVFQERSRQLRAADLDSGALTPPFDGPLRSDGWDPYELQDVVIVEDRIYALYPQRVVRYSTSGRIFGQDVVQGERDYRWLIPTSDRLFVISTSSSQARAPDAAGRRLQYVYQIYQLSPNCKLLGESYKLPAHTVRIEFIRAVDGMLLLGLSDSITRLVPMPAETAQP